jgi:hypothetical protein
MWAKPQNNPSVTIITMAITPKCLNFSRTGCCISVQANCKIALRLSKTAHFGFSYEVLNKPVDDE